MGEHSRPSTDAHGIGMKAGLLLKDWNGTETKETSKCHLRQPALQVSGKGSLMGPQEGHNWASSKGKNCIKLKCTPSQQDFCLLFLEINTHKGRKIFLSGLGGARGNVWLTLHCSCFQRWVYVREVKVPVPYAFAASARCLLHLSEQGYRCEGLILSPLYPPWLKTGPLNPAFQI